MSELQRFDCDICGQESMKESDLRTHLLLEHENNGGSCPLCDLQHLTLEELNWHVNTVHSSLLSPEATRLQVGRDMERAPGEPIPNLDVDPGPVANGSRTTMDTLMMRDLKPSINKKSLSSDRRKLSESSLLNLEEINKTIVDGSKTFSSNSELKNKSSTTLSNDKFQEFSGSCACSFVHGKGWDTEGSSEGLPATEYISLNGISETKKGSSEGLPATEYISLNGISETKKIDPTSSDIPEDLETGYSGSLTLQSEGSALLNHERKRTRNEAKLSSESSSSSVADVNIGTEESSSTCTPSTASPFKKFFRIFSPNKSNKSSGAENAETSSRKQLDGVWRHHPDCQVISDPECPFCDVSGLNPEAMTQHVECDHRDVFISPGPSTPKVNNRSMHMWNTSMIQKPTSPNSSKMTLLSLSKQAHNMQTVVICPICGLGSYDVDFLTVHVNTEHPVSDDTKSGTVSQAQGASKTSTLPEDQAGPSSSSTNSDTELSNCPVCGLTEMDAESLKVHVEAHFEVGLRESYSGDRQLAQQLAEEERQLQERRQRETFKQLQVKYGMDDSGSYRQQAEKDLEAAVVQGQMTVADYHQQRGSLRKALTVNIDDGKSCTLGLIQKMVKYYTNQTIQGLSYVKLCSETDHYSSTYGDKGWGCGYRNLQILLSSLVRIPEYRQVLCSGQNVIPSISKIQQLIEGAWAKDFDRQGCEQLGGHLVNSRKWIGATEIVALLSSLRAKCGLVDFHTPSGPGDTHPAMFEWVQEYFGRPGASSLWARGNKEANIQTDKIPLYLQHEGHSRTIIGCEVHRDKSIRLLLFDPSYVVNDMRGLGSARLDAYAMRPIRKSLAQMKAKQYQVVSVDRLMTSEQEYEQSKILHSVRKP